MRMPKKIIIKTTLATNYRKMALATTTDLLLLCSAAQVRAPVISHELSQNQKKSTDYAYCIIKEGGARNTQCMKCMESMDNPQGIASMA